MPTPIHAHSSAQNTKTPKPSEIKRLDLMTPKQVAHYIHMSEAFLERCRAEKRGPAFMKLGRRVYYRRDDVDRWLEENTLRPLVGDDV